MEHLLPWLRLQLTPGLGRIGLMRLIEHYKTPENALAETCKGWPRMPGLRQNLSTSVPMASSPKIHHACRTLVELKARLHTFWDNDYPVSLKQLHDPPAIFYSCGKIPEGPSLAIVGARKPTDFGKIFTERLAEELSSEGVIIVSGMARGIDSAAHRGALNGGGKTIAVLGCGIDRIYPPENKHLYQEIMDQGCIITEYPPGSEPLAGHFPGRNRIISALSHGTLVIEAARDSGSLITAEFALEQGRDVMAVPGGLDHDTSYGPNLLIKQGAHPVTEAADIMQLMGFSSKVNRTQPHSDEAASNLSEAEKKILSCIDLTPRHSDELVGESGLTPMELSVILLHLELQGFAKKLPGGRYIRGRRAT
jgi:DNA processing protein